ncbi:hypothetical protein [Nitriliruptor alkaliphilus]|uniref:hypothetical protein n=1 Tax=Nitriliruptor alkaliphilus TaxID=427918 RepID=UPI000698DC44|nr:hypothetical protein [Nitriliruptor alkaliphilus]
MNRRRRRTGVTLVPVLVVLLGLLGCRAALDPQAELEAAVAATAASPFTFSLSAQADRAALDQLGGDAVEAAAFLDGAGLTGAREPDGRLQVAFTLGGDVPLLEAISQGDGEGLLLRTGLGELLGLERRDPAEALGPALEELGVDAAGREALATSFAGGWVALTDVGDLGELLGATTDDGGDPAPASEGLASLLEEVTVTGARDAGEVRRLDVEVRAAALLAVLGLGGIDGGLGGIDGGLGGSDRALPGTLDLRDGQVLEVRLELSGGDLGADGPGTSGASSEAAGVVELVLRISSADDGHAVVERPEPGASLTAGQLLDLVDRLQTATTPPAP